MRQRVLRWLSPLLVTGFLCLAPVQAQQDNLRLGAGGQNQAASDDTPAPVFSFFVAISSTILILFTLLKPTRRQI